MIRKQLPPEPRIFDEARGLLTSSMQRHGQPIGCNGMVATFLARHRHIELYPYQLNVLRELDTLYPRMKRLVFSSTTKELKP